MKQASIIYLDHAAATPVDKRVLAAMLPYFSDDFYNPSSPYAPAVAVRRDYQAAKDTIARTIGARSNELIMTAGATESINLAFSGAKSHVVSSNIEHHAVLAAAGRLEHDLVAADKYGFVAANKIKAAIRPDTDLVSIALANNELGTIQPLSEIARVVNAERHRRLEAGEAQPIYLHCDASQGFGQLDINVSRLGVDMLTLNAGKIYGPKQVGLLWAAPLVQLSAQVVGGGQERGLRSGTENVSGVIGFAVAAQLAYDHRKSESRRLQKLRDSMQSQLVEAIPELVISGHPKKRLAGHLHISVPGIDAERLIFMLESDGVLLATGSACAANKGSRSHVLEAIELDAETADGSLRISLGKLSTESNTYRATELIIAAINSERQRVAR